MRLEWIVTPDDVARVKAFVATNRDNPIVRHRKRINLTKDKLRIEIAAFWFGLAASLLTTQQRSGPNSAVTRFISQTPFPLSFETCARKRDLPAFIEKTLARFGGIRRHSVVASELSENFQRLDSGLWQETQRRLDGLRRGAEQPDEEQVADFLDDHFLGLGPKQSRNLLQSLGLTRYEIPIDSRITKWLNAFGFSVVLSSTALADRNYYRFVLRGVQLLCARSEVFPCILDAAIFASFDEDRWTEDRIW